MPGGNRTDMLQACYIPHSPCNKSARREAEHPKVYDLSGTV